MLKHFLNGSLVTEDQLLISPRDLGFTRGYAVFDFLRTYGGRPFKLREHIDRLYNSARVIGLQIPWSKAQIETWIAETLTANEPGEKFIKIIVSGGVSDSMLPGGKPTIIILCDPAVQYPAGLYEQGIKLIAVKHGRTDPEAKSNSYIEGVKQMQRAHVTGAAEPLYYSDEQVFEGSNSNVFAVINGELLTPKTDVLQGITRAVLLDILQLDIPVKVQDFTLEQLLGASEVFLSASGKEITPVTSIDDRQIGDGVVGDVTKEVMRQFRAYISSDTR